MDANTCAILAGLNRAFYREYAGDFARTRHGWPAGFDAILPYLGGAANVLDLGCGNGRFLRFLAERGWRGRYYGLDSSRELLEIAADAAGASTQIMAGFVPGDLLEPDWPAALRNASVYGAPILPSDVIVAFAVVHHIPGRSNRERFFAQCSEQLRSGGRLIVTTWQFMSTPRLRARVLPWHTVNLRDEDVERGDYLLSWGAGAKGWRYCAFIDLQELSRLAGDAGLAAVSTFYADGHEGNLNLYGVYEKHGDAC